MSISNAIKELRKARNMTQGDIYRATGIERSALSRYESGKINDMGVNNAIKIARALGISVEAFWSLCQDHDGSPRAKEKGADEERERK